MNHPIRLRVPAQVVVEELLHSHRDVFLIRALCRVVHVVVVIEQVDLFVQPPQGDEHLDALIPRHRVVGVVMHHEQRRGDAIRPEER